LIISTFQGFQGFSGFHCAMIIAYLLQTHQISQHMSSYQIIRIFWQFLGAYPDFLQINSYVLSHVKLCWTE
jgi:hypothetical protein